RIVMSLRILLSTAFIASSFAASAQDAAKTFAITGEPNGDFSWKNVRQIDLNAGKMTKDLLVKSTSVRLMDSKLKKEIVSSSNVVRTGGTDNLVAAAAFDKRHNKLFF